LQQYNFTVGWAILSIKSASYRFSILIAVCCITWHGACIIYCQAEHAGNPSQKSDDDQLTAGCAL
jgi:hypothetical protein